MRICIVPNDPLASYKDLDRWMDRAHYYRDAGHEVLIFEPQNLSSGGYAGPILMKNGLYSQSDKCPDFEEFLEQYRPDVVRTMEGGRFVCSQVVGALAKKHGVAFVPSIHGIDVECNIVRKYAPREAAYYTACRESVSSLADAIIATQWSYLDYFTEWGWGHKTVFIPNYIMPHFEARDTPKQYDCIHVGRLCIDKDIKSLVEAVSEAECSSVFIGVGPDADFVQEAGIKLVSGIDNKALPDWYNASRICIVADPMIYTGFGMPIMEAQRCGLPVVFLAREEPAEHVEYFMEPSLRVETIQDMVSAIKKLLSNNAFYSSVANKAVRRIKKNFDRETILDAELDLYREVTKK